MEYLLLYSYYIIYENSIQVYLKKNQKNLNDFQGDY